MNKKNKLFKLTVLSSLFAFSLTSCNAASSTSVIITQNIDLTGVEFENVSETVTYDGLPHSIFAKNVPEGVTVTYENNGAIEIGTHKIIAHFSKKTSGYSSNVRYLETTQIATLNIVKDATNVSETLSEKLNKLTMDEMVVTYNGSPYTVLLNDPTLIPAGFKAMYSNNVHTAAGTYSVSCKIVNAETMISYRTLYSKMVINKAEIDIKDVKFENITYPSDGQVHTIEATNLPSNVSVRYELVNSNITDSLPANAITNVGYKEVKAIFTIDAASQLARSNYIIVNSNETDKTKNSMTARIEILAAGSVVYNIKYRVVQYEETFDSATNKVTNRTRKYVIDSNGQPAIYSQATLNTSYGNYISTSNLIAREGYSFEIADNTYSDILTERGYLVPDGATGGDIIIDYVPEIYTVNFSGENISLNSRDYTSVEERDLINPKVADGYRFMGWYSDSGFNFPITSLRGLTGNRTIYGRAINDSKLPSNFSIKDTFTTWDGTNKRVEVLGVPPSDVKLRYYYYKIESDGSKTLINELDENKTPTDVGRYSVVVSFYAIKDGNATDEKRYEDLTVYLVIEPANASSSSVFASTSFEWYAEFKDRRFEKANYPVLTNYPQNATNITYEYFDTNRNSLGVGDDNRPIDPGQYLVKASYKLADGTDEGKVFEIWTSFEITKKSYPIDFLNGIRKVFTDFTYEIDSGKGTVTVTRSDGKVSHYSLQFFADRGFTSGLTLRRDLNLDEGESPTRYFMLSDIFGVYHANSSFIKDDGSYIFRFANEDGFRPDYGNLIVKFTNDKINFNEVGQLSTMMYFEFEDEEYAKYNNLPNIMYSSLTVYTSGESRVQFVTSDGIEIKSESVTTGSSVPAPTLNDYSKYLPNDSNLYNEYEYEVKWVSDNMFSSLSHIVCDTKFVLTIIEREFSLKFVVEDVSKGTVNPLPNQTFTKSTSTTFNELSPTFEKGYYLAGYYTLNANGQKNSFDRNSTFAQVARSYNQNTNNLPYCTDLVVYILSAASQTSSTFDPNGGALNSGATFYQTFGQPFNLPADPIAPANSTFLGWALNGVIVTKTTIYDDYSGETLKFVAQYSSSTSTVTFLPENGDAYMTFGISNNEVIPIPSVIPTKVGYTFRGWYLNNVKLEEGTIFRGGSSLVYIAQYDVIKIDVIYHNNVIHSQVDEADDILIIKSADYGSIIPNPTTEEGSTLLPPTLSGYVFSGWSLDGTRLINSSNRITNVSQKLVDGVLSYYIDIYPVYQNNNYKITYAFNVENVLNTARDVIFNEVVSAEQAPARMGYYFDGWYTTSTFDAGTNFFDEILKNPADGINADSYPYERDIVLYAKWVRKEYKVTFRYVPDITKPNVYVDYPLNGMTIAYGQLLTSTGNIRTWLTEDEIYSTTVGTGLGLTRDVTPIFTYRNGSLISEGQAFLYDPASYELGDDINRVYDKLNPNNNTAIIYINSTINNYFNVSYVADENGLPTIQSVRGNADFTLKNHPIREGKRWVAYYYYYVENNQTKKYYLTSDGTINGTPLNTWNLSNAAVAKNGITNYVLYSEFEALKYRLFIRTNDQESLIGTRDFGGITKENYIETEYGQPYNILSNAFSTDFKAEINRILATKGYRFDYWRDNFGRIITANTVLTDPKAIDIESSYVYTQDNQIDYANSNYEAGIYLYAQVLPLTYKLTFFPDNNTNPYVINVGYNQSYTKMGDPVKDGYRFIGWKYFDAATFDIDKYRDGTLDPNCELKTGEFSDVRYNQTRDIIAVAQYDGDQYTITYKYSTFTSTDDSYSFNGDNYTNSTVVENIKFSQSYTLKDLNDNDFTNLNADYKKYLLLYDFYGWQDEANQTIYPAGTTFSEYNRSTSSTYRAIYTPKDFTVEFLYQTIDNSSMSALTGTKKVTRIASREKVILNNSLNTPADPVPNSDLYGSNKSWISSAKKGLTGKSLSTSHNYEMDLDFVFRFFYDSNYSLFNQDINNAILRDDDANNFRTLSFNLISNSSAGYYRIYLNNYNTNVTSLDGSTYYDVYGQNESGSEELLEAGSRIKLPNINLTISNGENFTCKDPRDGQVTIKSLQVLGGNNSNGDPYTYTINGNTFKPFLRTVYVFNGEYYLDGDLSPVGITGTRDNPTELYAFTTYVSGTYYENNGTKYYSELFNFTLKDEDGEYLKSYIPSKKGAVEDDYTLENKNEIAFAGFMNKAYTSIGNSYDNLTYRPVLIPYFYYDSQSGIIRKVTAIAHDQSGLGAFEESNYATQYFLPGTISYIASNSFKNAFTSNESGEEVYVSYLDSSAFFDYSAVILDSSLTGGSKLRAISASNFRYVGVDNTASYDSHRFFAGRLYTNRSYQTINTYTVLGFLNSFTSPTEYASSEGPNGKQGDYFYYSSSNPSRIPAFFKNLSAAVSDATAAGISKEIIAFSQTSSKDGVGQVPFNLAQREDAYPFFLYYGTAVDFIKSYGTLNDINALKITDEGDLPVGDEGLKYPDSPYYHIQNFYLTLPFKEAKKNTVKNIDIVSLTELNAIYLDTPSMIVNKLYKGTPEEKAYFDAKDPINSSDDDNFVTTYSNYQTGSNSAKLAYFYNGDSEEEGLNGTEYLIQQLIGQDQEKANKIRDNFNSKCFEYEYDSDGNVVDGTLTKMIATKNYKTQSVEYFYIGNYESFLGNGKDYVDQYKGQIITFLDLTNDQLVDFDPENPLGIIDQDTKLKKIYIGTSSSYLASLSSEQIKDRIDENFLINCINSETDYNITPLFFGTLDKYRNLDRTDASINSNYPLQEGFLIQCLQSEDTTNISLVRDTIFAYFNDHDSSDTTKFIDYTTTLYQFSEGGDFITTNNAPFYYNLTLVDDPKLIFQVKLDPTDTTRNIYYTSTASTFASSYFDTFKLSTIAVLNYDYNKDQRYDGTVRTSLTSNDLERLFVGTIDDIGTTDGKVSWSNIRNSNNLIPSQHVAYYLTAQTSSTIVYDVASNTIFDNRMNGNNTSTYRTYLTYFFNSYDTDDNRYKNLVTVAGSNYYYNENIKTILAGVNTLNLKTDLYNLLTSNSLIYNALYCFKDNNDDGNKNTIASSNFLPMYYGTDQNLLESIKAGRVTINSRFIFVKPDNNYTADIADVSVDDMGLAFGVDSKDGTILKAYVSSLGAPSLDNKDSYINNKNRFISIITLTDDKTDDKEASYDIYYYFRGLSTSAEARKLLFSLTEDETDLKYHNKFVLYEGSNKDASDDFYNFVGTIDDIISKKSDPLLRYNSFYNLFDKIEIDETNHQIKDAHGSIFFMGNAASLEANSTALGYSDGGGFINTQIVDENFRIGVGGLNDVNKSNYDNIQFYADLITVLLLDSPKAYSVIDEIKNSSTFMPVSYYRGEFFNYQYQDNNDIFDYLFLGKQIGGDKGDDYRGGKTLSDDVYTNKYNFVIKNDDGGARNSFFLFRGNNSLNKGVFAFDDNKYNKADIRNGQLFGTDQLDLSATDDEKNLAIPVYYDFSEHPSVSNPSLLKTYEGYDIITVIEDNVEEDPTKVDKYGDNEIERIYSSITYIGSPSKFIEQRKVNNTPLYTYQDSSTFFENDAFIPSNFYIYNKSAFNYAEIVYQTDTEGNSTFSESDSGSLRTMLLVDNSVILNTHNGKKRNNNTSMAFYASLFTNRFNNAVPLLLNYNTTVFSARISYINPVITVIGNNDVDGNGKITNQDITNKLYIGASQPVDITKILINQNKESQFKLRNNIDSILFDDNLTSEDSHLYDDEEVIGITSKDEGLLDRAGPNTSTEEGKYESDQSIGSTRPVLVYYINKYIDQGVDPTESPVVDADKIASVSDYKKIIKANYIGDGFIKQKTDATGAPVEDASGNPIYDYTSIAQYYSDLDIKDAAGNITTYGVMDLIPVVQFKKQVQVEVGRNPSPTEDDPDHEDIEYENQNVTVIAELLSMSNLTNNKTSISYLSAGWFGYGTEYGLQMDGNNIANSWLSQASLGSKIQDNRVYIPRWVKHYTEQIFDDGSVVPKLQSLLDSQGAPTNRTYDGRTYMKIDNPNTLPVQYAATSVDNEFIADFSTDSTFDSYLKLDLVDAEENYGDTTTINQGYYPQTLVTSTPAIRRLNTAFDLALEKEYSHGPVARYIQDASDLLANTDYDSLSNSSKDESLKNHQTVIFKLGDTWYLRHVAQKDMRIFFDGSIGGLTPTDISTGTVYYFKFEPITWKNLNPNNEASPYFVPNKILDVTTTMTDYLNYDFTKNTFKKYTFSENKKIADKYLGGSNSSTDSIYDTYRNNSYTPSDVNIYTDFDDNSNPFSNDFSDAQNNSFYFNDALRASGKTSLLEYMLDGNDTETTDDYKLSTVISNFAMYKFYCYFGAGNSYTYQDFYKAATTDSEALLSSYSFYNARIIFNTLIDGSTLGVEYINIDYYDVPLSYYSNKIYIFNQYSRAFALGDIGFFYPIVRLEYTTNSNN